MIYQIPRAALKAGDMAQTAEFFSFGTNDLAPESTLRLFTRRHRRVRARVRQDGAAAGGPVPDAGSIGRGRVDSYRDRVRGRAVRPNLKVGICGEHGGEEASVIFCQAIRNLVSRLKKKSKRGGKVSGHARRAAAGS